MPRLTLAKLDFHLGQLSRGILLPVNRLAHHEEPIGADHAFFQLRQVGQRVGCPGDIHAAFAEPVRGANPVLFIHQLVQRQDLPRLRVTELGQAFSRGPAQFQVSSDGQRIRTGRRWSGGLGLGQRFGCGRLAWTRASSGRCGCFSSCRSRSKDWGGCRDGLDRRRGRITRRRFFRRLGLYRRGIAADECSEAED